MSVTRLAIGEYVALSAPPYGECMCWRRGRKTTLCVANGHRASPDARAQAQEAARDAGKVVQAGNDVEIPYKDGRRILIELPRRQSRGVWSYPVRVLLTPPALVRCRRVGSPNATLFITTLRFWES